MQQIDCTSEDDMAVVFALCKAGNLPSHRYRIREGTHTGGGPTELYRQLRTVVGENLPETLCSNVVCALCRSNILKALKQKERFEQSRRELVEKLRGVPASSLLPCNAQPAALKAVSPQRSSQPWKRPRLSPLTVSPLAKRPLSATSVS